MRISEVFHSVQGEGRFAGVPTLFIRSTGCHLRCTWCDSAYAFHGGRTVPTTDLIAQANAQATQMVCFTGGEPLLQKDALDLVRGLLGAGHHVIIETSGSLDLDAYLALEPRDNLCLSVDVKCPGSGEAEANRFEELAKLGPHDQVKFVIADETDYAYAAKHLELVPSATPVYFQPVWGIETKWLAERLLADGLRARLSLQMHKLIWGDIPGV